MNIVKSYAGSTYPENPRSLEWEGQQYEVQEIIHRTREPEGLRFIVRCSPEDQVFELYYHLINGDWRIQPKGFSKHSPNETGE
jgi:hypothetical protein